ncbi:alpha/beta hydrolase [Streptomyces sp. NPDC002690]
MTDQRPTLVLVHGAWHQPSTWDLLRGELDALGYPSLAVKLPTSGPGAHGGVPDDAEVIRAACEGVGGPVVVVAHSYGGVPATEAVAGLPGLRQLIYVAAFVPDVGESMYSMLGAPEPDAVEGMFPIGDDPRTQLYADVPEAVADLALDRLVDQHHQPFVDRVTRAAWHAVPSAYVVTEQDASIAVPVQERMAVRTKDVRRIATSHSPHLSRPAELAALIDSIVRG